MCSETSMRTRSSGGFIFLLKLWPRPGSRRGRSERCLRIRALGKPAWRWQIAPDGILPRPLVGAGLAGLSAAVVLVGIGREIVVHELARHAGGRCRSYFEPALGLTIDNGNHLLLSANHAALAFLKTIGSDRELVGPSHA